MKNRAILLIILASLLWGTSGIFVNYLSPYGITAFQMTAIRGAVSVLVIGAYMLITAKKMITKVFALKLRNLPLIAGAGLSMFVTAAAYYISMQLTSIATSVILMYTAPLFVTCYSVIFLKEKLTVKKALSVIAIFAGCAFVSGVVGGIKMNFWGVLIGLLSGISYSAYNIITKAEMKITHAISTERKEYHLPFEIAFFLLLFVSAKLTESSKNPPIKEKAKNIPPPKIKPIQNFTNIANRSPQAADAIAKPPKNF
jgi:drug/metabolite transporter (DMT)-like permease